MIRAEKTVLQIRKYHEIPQWDAFVAEHPQGTLLHTKRMIQCEEATKLHYPYAYGALDPAGNLCALLVAVRVKTLMNVPSQLTSRSILFAEPICLDTSAGQEGIRLLLKQHDEYMRKRTLFAELRPFQETTQLRPALVESGYQWLGYLNYELRIDRSEAELFGAIGPKSRNNVRCAERKGVIVDEVEPVRSANMIYSLLSESYSRAKIPMVDRSLFQVAATNFSRSQLRVLVAKYNDAPIAVGCFLLYKKRVYCWFAGTKRVSGVPASSCIFWEAIRKFSREGFEIFDFAGGGWEGKEYGPGRFKAKFGGEQTNYGRYRKIYSPLMMRAAESVYERLREFYVLGGQQSMQSKLVGLFRSA